MRTIICIALVSFLTATAPLHSKDASVVPQNNLKRHVTILAKDIGDRNYTKPAQLKKAAEYIKKEFAKAGYKPQEQSFTAEKYPGIEFKNIIAVKEGSKKDAPVIILMAHYDTFPGTPGADDNASGTAVLLELARQLKDVTHEKTVKFIAVANEEPPFFKTEDMGSYRYAMEAKKNNEKVALMLSIECVGYFDEKPKTQTYPRFMHLVYPDKGDFISVVANPSSLGMMWRTAKSFKKVEGLKVEFSAAPPAIVNSVSLSDQWSFWQFGYKGLMITDTAFYRNFAYHTPGDTWERLDYARMEKITEAVKFAVADFSAD